MKTQLLLRTSSNTLDYHVINAGIAAAVDATLGFGKIPTLLLSPSLSRTVEDMPYNTCSLQTLLSLPKNGKRGYFPMHALVEGLQQDN